MCVLGACVVKKTQRSNLDLKLPLCEHLVISQMCTLAFMLAVSSAVASAAEKTMSLPLCEKVTVQFRLVPSTPCYISTSCLLLLCASNSRKSFI